MLIWLDSFGCGVWVGDVWHAVGCLRHQTPAFLVWGVGLVGFLVFDFWIVDASNTYTYVWVLV
ncbi:hypothetical protein GCM10027076_32770 [Nocardioides montaniterrae]